MRGTEPVDHGMVGRATGLVRRREARTGSGRRERAAETVPAEAEASVRGAPITLGNGRAPAHEAGFEAPLWRSLAVYRMVSLGYAAMVIAGNHASYRYPLGGWAVLGVMAGWTACTVYAYAGPARWRGWVLAGDLAVTVACLLSTGLVETPARLAAGAPNLTVSWAAAPVLAWAVAGGKRCGLIAAVVVSLPDLVLHGAVAGRLSYQTLDGTVLLLMGGIVVGHVARLGAAAEARMAQAIQLEAATSERERLARRIHDSVLQVLTLVQRRGGELGGAAAELGRLAGEQQAALRTLVGAPEPATDDGGRCDLSALLRGLSSMTVTVSTPATPVRLTTRTADEIRAAVGAALDNVRHHCGDDARAWVLVEDAGDTVTVSVRDDGPGMAPGRPAEAEADGRLGLAQSIHGRIRDLGGTVVITSAPGQGTEIEMSVPVA